MNGLVLYGCTDPGPAHPELGGGIFEEDGNMGQNGQTNFFQTIFKGCAPETKCVHNLFKRETKTSSFSCDQVKNTFCPIARK